MVGFASPECAHAASGKRFGIGRLIALSALLGACAASPPVNPGYISVGRPAHRGAVEAGAQGGIVEAIPDARGAGTLHVEPYLGKTSSIPVGASYQETVDDADRMTVVAGRAGYRDRIPAHPLGYGFGLGPNYMRYGAPGDGDGRADDVDEGTTGLGLAVDGEIIVGHRWRYFGFSFVARPAVSWNQVAFTTLWIPFELSAALFPLENVGVTVSGIAAMGMVFFDEREQLGGFEDAEGLLGLTAMDGAMAGVTWSSF